MAQLAYDIERNDVGIKGGRQDQWAAAFGGFNFMEFNGDEVVVTPLRLSEYLINELEYNLILCFTGSRESQPIIDSQMESAKKNEAAPLAAMDQVKAIAYEMKKRFSRATSIASARCCTKAGSRKSRWPKALPHRGSMNSTRSDRRQDHGARGAAATSCSIARLISGTSSEGVETLADDVSFVKRTIEQQMSAAPGACDFAANGAGLASLFIKFVDARRRDPLGRLFFLHPALVKHVAEFVRVSLKERFLHCVGDRFYLVHRGKRSASSCLTLSI